MGVWLKQEKGKRFKALSKARANFETGLGNWQYDSGQGNASQTTLKWDGKQHNIFS